MIAARFQQLISKYGSDSTVSLFITFMLKYAAKPKICIDYNRRAYVSRFKSHYLRATFDTDLSFRLANDLFVNENSNCRSVDEKYTILELKYENNTPFWMQSLISKYNIRASALSKYAIATRRLIS